MKLTKQELEVFDKMLVDKYQKLEAELLNLRNRYKVLQINYEAEKIKVKKLSEQLETLNKDYRNSQGYKDLKRINKLLRKQLITYKRTVGELVYKLNNNK